MAPTIKPMLNESLSIITAPIIIRRIEPGKWTTIAAMNTLKSKEAGGGATSWPKRMAAIIRTGAQGEPFRNNGTIIISRIRKTSPVIKPAHTVAFQLIILIKLF